MPMIQVTMLEGRTVEQKHARRPPELSMFHSSESASRSTK